MDVNTREKQFLFSLDEISMSAILLQFRRQRLFINRLFKYAQVSFLPWIRNLLHFQAAHNVMQIAETTVDDEANENAEIGNGKKAAGVLNELVNAATFLGIDINIDELEVYTFKIQMRMFVDSRGLYSRLA